MENLKGQALQDYLNIMWLTAPSREVSDIEGKYLESVTRLIEYKLNFENFPKGSRIFEDTITRKSRFLLPANFDIDPAEVADYIVTEIMFMTKSCSIYTVISAGLVLRDDKQYHSLLIRFQGEELST